VAKTFYKHITAFEEKYHDKLARGYYEESGCVDDMTWDDFVELQYELYLQGKGVWSSE
jgi:hypothetical protein